jgi:hypothetical protein
LCNLPEHGHWDDLSMTQITSHLLSNRCNTVVRKEPPSGPRSRCVVQMRSVPHPEKGFAFTSPRCADSDLSFVAQLQ